MTDLDRGRIDTSWSDAARTAGSAPEPVRVEAREGMIIERRRRAVGAAPQGIYRVLTGMGADRGWYFRRLVVEAARDAGQAPGGRRPAKGAAPSR